VEQTLSSNKFRTGENKEVATTEFVAGAIDPVPTPGRRLCGRSRRTAPPAILPVGSPATLYHRFWEGCRTGSFLHCRLTSV